MSQAIATRTLAILFTDIQGSTALWERVPDAMRVALARHDAILRAAVAGHGGEVAKTMGDGLMAIFPAAGDGVAACLDAQLALAREPWGETGSLRVRMGLHVGEVQVPGDDYHGPAVNRAARIMAAGHGGQVLLSAAAAALVADDLPDGASLLDLGEHRLKDLGRPERVFQLRHPDLPSSFPSLVGHERRERYALPGEPTSFVGREQELATILERLRDPSVRLLTLLGPGGIGKTRLALRAAHALEDAFRDGAAFVDLSPVRDPDEVVVAIARHLGLSDASEATQVDELAARLREQELLLVLDNFEQVTGAAPAVARVLRDAPGLTLLVTSREALRVRDEHVLPVPPLALPDESTRHRPADHLSRFEAIGFFVERARAVVPDFRLTDENARLVVEICRRLDGLPLAIELATARLALFPLEALLERLDDRLALLRAGARDLPERQQTLRATIDWSYQLLQPGEQRLFELLAAFASPHLDAVEAVARSLRESWPDGADPLDGADPIDGIASLLDKSLLRQRPTAGGDPGFLMLETIREYATERLEERPRLASAARRAHATWHADLAESETARLGGPDRADALARLTSHLEDLRAAWRFWVTEGDLGRLDALIDALWPAFDARGWYRATMALADDMLRLLEAQPRTRDRIDMEVTLRTSRARALLAMQGYTAEVELAFERALEVEGAQVERLFPVLRSLANLHTYRGEFAKAAEVGRQVLRLAEGPEGEGLEGDGHLILGGAIGFMGDLEAGMAELERAVAWFERSRFRSGRFRLGNHPHVASLTTSGLFHWLLGRPDTALERTERAVALARSLDHPSTKAYALHHSGFLGLWRDEPERVRERALGVLEVADEHDLPIWNAVGTSVLGAAMVQLGAPEAGLERISEGIARYTGLRTPPVFWPLLLLLRAAACRRAGRVEEGLGTIGQAIELARPGSGMPLVGELLIVRGDLRLAAGDRTGALEDYEGAAAESRQVGARMTVLRAMVRLCRTAPAGSSDAARHRDALREVLATFDEGLDLPDLREAAALSRA
jgi:predicted ATPase/class 3 adenylate cyclase